MMAFMLGDLLFAMLVGPRRGQQICVNCDGRGQPVLFSRNADSLRYPASLTKIMTLYLLFEDIEAGKIS